MDMRRAINIITESVRELERQRDTDGGDPPPRRPRGEGEGPKEGRFWLKGGALIPITGTCNEIVRLSGQNVMQKPDAFGLGVDDIKAMLKPSSDASAEYERLLQEPGLDLSHTAWLWRSSAIVFERMLRDGWGLIHYNPPARFHLTVVPDAAKRMLENAATRFPLLQIDNLMITLVTSFAGLSDKHPHMSKNRTLNFRRDEIRGFAGSFGAAMDWSAGRKDAPDSNYLYLAAGAPTQATQMGVRTPEGYRKRWAVKCQMSGANAVARVPRSIVNSIDCRAHWLRGISEPTRNGVVAIYSDRPFGIPNDMIERRQEDGSWA